MKKRIVSSFSAIFVGVLFLCSCGLNRKTANDHSPANAVQYYEGDSSIATSIDDNISTSNIETTETRPSEPTQEPEPNITSTEPPAPETTPTTTTSTTPTTIEIAAEPPVEYQELIVHFIDVGQGDSTFIELPNGETMLIDAGEGEYGDKVVAYIYNQGYDTLDYVVATHPHSDHIGGIADVLNAFPAENFYMTSYVNPTQSFDDMLTAVENNGAVAHEVMAGTVILDEPELLVEVVAPKALADDSNNNSVVIKLTYGETKFLFTGDAEKAEEDGIWTNIKCDVLKIGHHGSDTSSTKNFLKKVEPTYAVISCGLYNSYGHPDEVVLKRLYDRNINVYRTDIQGTIVFRSDGKDITVNFAPAQYTPPAVTTSTTTQVTEPQQQEPTASVTYVLNTNTKKIHYPSCSSVDQMKEKNKAYTDDYAGVIAQGYVPCKNCNPTG